MKKSRRSESRHAGGSQSVWRGSVESGSEGVPRPAGETGGQLVRQRTQLGPRSAEPIPAVRMKSRSLHPLMYRRRLEDGGGAKAGDLVAVYAEQHSQPFGYGLFNTRSELCVRLLWHGSELPGDDAWRAKLAAASALRDEGRQPAIRFRMPGTDFTWDDLVRGELTFTAEHVPDYVIVRATGEPG